MVANFIKICLSSEIRQSFSLLIPILISLVISKISRSIVKNIISFYYCHKPMRMPIFTLKIFRYFLLLGIVFYGIILYSIYFGNIDNYTCLGSMYKFAIVMGTLVYIHSFFIINKAILIFKYK